MFKFKAAGLIISLSLITLMCIAADCEVVKYKTVVEANNNKVVRTDTVVIRINKRMGEKYADISLNYTKDNPITELTAWITDKNGSVIRILKNKEIIESNAYSHAFYSDYLVKRFTLKHNDYPYTITYTYQETAKQYLFVADWYPVIGPDVPTLAASLTFIRPENFKVILIQKNLRNPEILSSSTILTERWQATYDGSIREEVLSESPRDHLPGLTIIPANFNYGIPGSNSSWLSFGEWLSKLISGLDELPESEKSLISKEIINLKDKTEIIKALYHYLQDHTRYVNVNIGIGGMKPYPASYVSQNKFGDCKALSNYMIALLNFAGIRSHYVCINSEDNPRKFYPDIPFQQFNHVIIAVPLDGDTIWLENTANCIPFGYFSHIQNRPALLVDGSNSRLVNIPAVNPEKLINCRHFNFNINENGGSSVTSRFVFRGSEFEDLSYMIMNSTPAEQNDQVHNFLPFSAFILNDWQIIKRGRDMDNLTLTASLFINKLTYPVGNQSYFAFQPADIPQFEQPAYRKLPVNISKPIITNDTLNYNLPAGRKFAEVPTGKIIENKYGKYCVNFQINGSSLIITREFRLNPMKISLVEYPDFFNFITAIKNHEKLKILFQ